MFGEIIGDRGGCFTGQGEHAFLTVLSFANMELVALPVDVVDLQAGELGAAQPKL